MLRPITTAHLAQTMSLLELTASELSQKIESELASNPALEVRTEKRCPSCFRPIVNSEPCPRCSLPKTLSPDEPIIFVSPQEDFRVYNGQVPQEMPDDNLSVAFDDLPTFVLRQIAPELQPEDRRIAAHILTNLNEDGLLDIPLMEIARYHHVSLSMVEKVLRLIQHAEPVGVGSPTTQEALLIQLDILAESQTGSPWLSYASQAIRSGMDLLSRRQFADLGRLLRISTSQAQEVARFISDNLNPFPARAFWGDVRLGQGSSPHVYLSPDVIINFMYGVPESPLMVEIMAPFSGVLQVNPLFRQALNQAPADKCEQWKSDLERADLLVKCLQQRTNTIVRLMRRITTLQREFIISGDQYLRPVTRASLADELDVHESTISRAVSSKTVQLPNGHIIPLAKFFDRSLHIRTVIKQIICEETKPLSDSEIVELLSKQGHKIARRTVAKYRAMEGILPSHLRHHHPDRQAKE